MPHLGFVYAILASITWGLLYTIDEKILGKTSPIVLLFVTSFLVTIVTLPFALRDTESIKSLAYSGRLHIGLMLASVALSALASFFIFSGIKLLDAPTASIFEIAYPLFVVLFSYLLYRTPLSSAFFVGGALMLVGSVIVIKYA